MNNTKTISIKEWKSFFKSRGIEQSLINEYISNIEKLKDKNLPIIFEIEHLSYLVNINIEILNKMIFSNKSFYQEFKIPKRNKGEFREIHAPYPSLKCVQDWIYNNILQYAKIHYNAHGYVKNKSIKTNAKKHLNKKELFKIDLKDFFPTIKIPRIIEQFKRLGYSKNMSLCLATLCCQNDYLTQGSPTSPALSNLVAYKLDKRLTTLAKRNNLVYTRYVDDIAISGDDIHHFLQKLICEIIEEEGFIVNYEKTYLNKENSNKRLLTGIIIKDDKLTIPRETKRKLKQEIYYISKFGIKSHLISINNKNPYYYESLLGKLQYWKFIEPTSKDVDKLIKILNDSI